MTALEILLAVAGFVVTALVIVAMVLLTPAGTKEVHVAEVDSMGSNLSQAESVAARTT
jgi:hypothetical protein